MVGVLNIVGTIAKQILGGTPIGALVKKHGTKLVNEAKKHAKDLTTSRTGGQKQTAAAIKGTRTGRFLDRKGIAKGFAAGEVLRQASKTGKPSSKKDKFLDRVVKKTERKPKKTNAKLGKPSDIAKRLPTSHTIKRGDTFTSIAREKGTTVAKLKELNKVDPKKLQVGAKVKLR